MVKIATKKIERVIITYDVAAEKEGALALEREHHRELGYSTIFSYHCKDDLLHYTGEAVIVLEREIL